MGDHVHLFYFETLAEIPEEEQYLDRLRENSGPCTLLYLRVYVFHAVIDFFVCTDSLNKAIKSMWGRTIRVLVVINMEHIIPVFFLRQRLPATCLFNPSKQVLLHLLVAVVRISRLSEGVMKVLK